MAKIGPLLALSISLGLPISILAQSVQEFVRQASSLQDQHQLEQALRVLEKAIQKHPGSPEVLFHMGSLLLQLGQTEAAEGVLDRALQLAPGNAAILKKSAEAKLRSGKTEEAIRLLEKTLWYSPADAEAQYRLSYSQFVQGDQQAALKAVEEAINLDPLSAKYRRFHAQLLHFEGHSDKALEELRVAYRLDPKDPQTLYQLSRRYRQNGSLGQAIEYLELATELDPENPLYLREAADLFQLAGDPQLADEAAKRADQLLDAFSAYSRALELSASGQTDAAIHVLEEVNREAESFVTGRLMLADLYQRTGRRQQAVQVFEEVLLKNPASSQARREIAWIRAGEGALDSALQILRADGALQPDLGLLQGYQYFLQEDWTQALKAFEELREKYPLDTDLLQVISFCLNEMGQQQAALQNLEKAIQLEPGNRDLQEQKNDTMFDQAQEALERRDWGRASEVLIKLVERDPENPDYHLRLAYAYQRSGRLELAVRSYQNGLALQPGEAWALQNLATTLSLLQRYDQARALWERIASRTPTAEALLQLGLCYSHLGRDVEAERAFEKALKTGGERPEILYNLGIARLRLMKLDDGWKLIRLSARQGYQPAANLLRQARQHQEK